MQLKVKFDTNDFNVLKTSVLIFSLVDTLINYGEHAETCSELQFKLRKLERESIRTEIETEE